MPESTAYASEMRLYDDAGHRLYLSAEERSRFLAAVTNQPREDRCSANYTGLRPLWRSRSP